VCSAASPELLEQLENVRLEAPEKLVLNCRISPGDPAAQSSWYRDGTSGVFSEIFTDQKYEITAHDDTRSLIIAVSEVTDSATYRCEAVNKYGKVRTQCRVVVLRMFHVY